MNRSPAEGGSTGRDSFVTLEKVEIRRRARAFSASWAGVSSEQSDKQPFWDAFFNVFGVQRRRVATYEAIAKRASTGRAGWVDLLLPGQMAVEHKSAGKSLDAAMGQLIDYLPSLPAAEHPWLLVVSDFARFKWKNLDTGQSGSFTLEQFPDHVELFWWLAGWLGIGSLTATTAMRWRLTLPRPNCSLMCMTLCSPLVIRSKVTGSG